MGVARYHQVEQRAAFCRRKRRTVEIAARNARFRNNLNGESAINASASQIHAPPERKEYARKFFRDNIDEHGGAECEGVQAGHHRRKIVELPVNRRRAARCM